MSDVEYPFFAGCFFIALMKIAQLLKVELPADPNKHLGWYKEVSDKVSSVLLRFTQIKERLEKDFTEIVDRVYELMVAASNMWAA